MNLDEAYALLAEEAAKYEQRSYDELCGMDGQEKLSYDLVAGSGVRYFVEADERLQQEGGKSRGRPHQT